MVCNTTNNTVVVVAGGGAVAVVWALRSVWFLGLLVCLWKFFSLEKKHSELSSDRRLKRRRSRYVRRSLCVLFTLSGVFQLVWSIDSQSLLCLYSLPVRVCLLMTSWNLFVAAWLVVTMSWFDVASFRKPGGFRKMFNWTPYKFVSILLVFLVLLQVGIFIFASGLNKNVYFQLVPMILFGLTIFVLLCFGITAAYKLISSSLQYSKSLTASSSLQIEWETRLKCIFTICVVCVVVTFHYVLIAWAFFSPLEYWELEASLLYFSLKHLSFALLLPFLVWQIFPVNEDKDDTRKVSSIKCNYFDFVGRCSRFMLCKKNDDGGGADKNIDNSAADLQMSPRNSDDTPKPPANARI